MIFTSSLHVTWREGGLGLPTRRREPDVGTRIAVIAAVGGAGCRGLLGTASVTDGATEAPRHCALVPDSDCMLLGMVTTVTRSLPRHGTTAGTPSG